MILTVGAFDGFHRGHRRLLDEAREIAKNSGADGDWGVVTFEPHPGVFMGAFKGTLFTQRERELLRRVLGVPNMFTLHFDEKLKNLSPEEFWAKLKRDFNATGVVMGQDFRFGRNQAGSAEILASLCCKDSFPAKIVELEEHDGVRRSSTEIRAAITIGDVQIVADLLGYPWFMCCSVIHGLQRGRGMGFPTANLNIASRESAGGLIPSDGVYAVALLLDNKWYGGALSIGNNPTFGDIHEKCAEVFVLDFHGNLYEQVIPVLLLDRLRPMIKFPESESLKCQIQQDVTRCREIFSANLSVNKEKSFFASFAANFAKL